VSSGTIIALEIAITLGVVFGWGFWELHKLKRDK
jgi:predicted negative regulator of RcsB-dependent stress response